MATIDWSYSTPYVIEETSPVDHAFRALPLEPQCGDPDCVIAEDSHGGDCLVRWSKYQPVLFALEDLVAELTEVRKRDGEPDSDALTRARAALDLAAVASVKLGHES